MASLEDIDAQNDYALRNFTAALVEPIEDLAALIRDGEGTVGYEDLLSPANAPEWALPWLAQFVGVKLTDRPPPPDFVDPDDPPDPEGDRARLVAAQRAQIVERPAFRRGQPAEIRAAVASTLTGLRRVIIEERDASAYHLTIATYDSETPDPAWTEEVALGAVPGGLVATYVTRVGQTYAQLAERHADYAAVLAAYPSYAAVRDFEPI